MDGDDDGKIVFNVVHVRCSICDAHERSQNLNASKPIGNAPVFSCYFNRVRMMDRLVFLFLPSSSAKNRKHVNTWSSSVN